VEYGGRKTEGGRLLLLSSPNSQAGPTSGMTPRRQMLFPNGASGLAAGQPRKPVAAFVVDWFYALPPCKWLPLIGGHVTPFSEKRARRTERTVPSTTMPPKPQNVKAVTSGCRGPHRELGGGCATGRAAPSSAGRPTKLAGPVAINLDLNQQQHERMLTEGLDFGEDLRLEDSIGTIRLVITDLSSSRYGTVTIPGVGPARKPAH